jgi:hypothetical protein
MTDALFGRRASLTIAAGGSALDLSEFHFRFQISAADFESPNSAVIRVYNLSRDTVRSLVGPTSEYTRVVVQAGYENGAFGVIFDGTIKQWRVGKENATTTYLDILAAENDVEYNFGVGNVTIAAGTTAIDRMTQIAQAMGLSLGDLDPRITGVVPSPRGKVAWGNARLQMRSLSKSLGATWNIEGGKINVTTLQGYRAGEAVVISPATGMVGVPEQTDQGIKVRALINPRLRVGGLVQIAADSINATSQADLRADGVFQQRNLPIGQVVYNSRYGATAYYANVSTDGFYRVYAIDYSGDTRGQEWYADLICLAVDISSQTVQAKN